MRITRLDFVAATVAGLVVWSCAVAQTFFVDRMCLANGGLCDNPPACQSTGQSCILCNEHIHHDSCSHIMDDVDCQMLSPDPDDCGNKIIGVCSGPGGTCLGDISEEWCAKRRCAVVMP